MSSWSRPEATGKADSPQETFDNNLWFTIALKHKGRPKRGEPKTGYIFGSGTQGTGYYRDTEDDRAARGNVEEQNKLQDKADDLPVPASMNTSSASRYTETLKMVLPDWLPRRTRRRHRDGKRIRDKTRGSKPTPVLGNLCFTTCASTWARDCGLAAIDSWNLNAWHAGSYAAFKSSAETMLMQETKIKDEESCARAEDMASRNGWNAKLNCSATTDMGAASAGIGIMSKKHVGAR